MPNHDLLPPPELHDHWKTSNYPHGVRRGPTLLIATGTLFGFCLLAVLGRLGVRSSRKSLGPDDALMVSAMMLCTAVDVGIYFSFLKYGLDRHSWDLTESMTISSRKISLAIEAVNLACTSFTKISILYFCKRLAGGTYKTSKYNLVVQASIFFVAASLAVLLITLFLSCYPLKAFWLQFSPGWETRSQYACLDEFVHLISVTSISVAEDFIAFGVPAALLWRLQIGRKKKTALACLLGLGFFPCIAGVMRIVYTIRVYDGYDATWNAYPAYVCLVVETHLGILCASAPALNSSAANLVRHVRANSNWSVLKNRGRDRAGSTRARPDPDIDLEVQEIHRNRAEAAPKPPPKDAKGPISFAGAVVTSGLAMNPPSEEDEVEMERAYICERPLQSIAQLVLFNRSQASISGFSGTASDMPTVPEHDETRPFIPAHTRWSALSDDGLTALPAPSMAWTKRY